MSDQRRNYLNSLLTDAGAGRKNGGVAPATRPAVAPETAEFARSDMMPTPEGKAMSAGRRRYLESFLGKGKGDGDGDGAGEVAVFASPGSGQLSPGGFR
jgi:hypothetical protein